MVDHVRNNPAYHGYESIPGVRTHGMDYDGRRPIVGDNFVSFGVSRDYSRHGGLNSSGETPDDPRPAKKRRTSGIYSPRRKSVKKSRSVRKSRRKSVKKSRSVRKSRRKSVKKSRSVRKSRRKSVKKSRSVRKSRRRSVRKSRRK